MIDVVKQFNGGICENCGAKLRESVYVGGDHDPIAECLSCGKHYGCSGCNRERGA
jgi:hypothetical protein